MKTSQFIINLEQLGYRTEKLSDRIRIYSSKHKLLIIVSRISMHSMDNRWEDFNKLTTDKKQMLMESVYEYLNTPIVKRKEEKVYKLRHKWLASGGTGTNNYLTFRKSKNIFSLTSKENLEDFKTKATIAEWEHLTIRTWEQLLKDFDEVEVTK